jgi:hypothetical protein
MDLQKGAGCAIKPPLSSMQALSHNVFHAVSFLLYGVVQMVISKVR